MALHYTDSQNFKNNGVIGGNMPKKIEKNENVEMPSEQEQKPEAAPISALQYVRQLGYLSYTFAKSFEYVDLDADPRPYAVAKKVNVMGMKEEDGTTPYIGLAFVGLLDDPLFLIIMDKNNLKESIANIEPKSDFLGLEFHGVNKRLGSIALIALPKKAYLEFAESIMKKA